MTPAPGPLRGHLTGRLDGLPPGAVLDDNGQIETGPPACPVPPGPL
jgi:hypothetical protein